MNHTTAVVLEVLLFIALLWGLGFIVALRIVRAGADPHSAPTLRAPKYPRVPREFENGEWKVVGG